ncbi:MAG: hypothetical protein PF436_01555 [Prolixibacteraceae bacterium]|jgi:hypothetical protein|nr:hypothetical protein [Prolixibacteraceae bacterium]
MRFNLIFAVFIFIIFDAFSQNIIDNKAVKPNFFLDCHDCDFDFVRQQLKNVSFVRNPELADVHILSTESGTGSGGRKYFLQFIGRNDYIGENTEYVYITQQMASDDDVRQGLLKLVKAGVLHFYSTSGYKHNVVVEFNSEAKNSDSIFIYDRWDKWIFNVDAGGDFELEESKNEVGFDFGVSVEKITEQWKSDFDVELHNNVETYIDANEEIKNEQQQFRISAEYINSLSQHWSAGFFADYYSDTYLNAKNNIDGRLGIEYNVFPWEFSNRKVFTFRYVVGGEYKQYFEETIYEKTEESLWFEAAEISIDIIQPWGVIESSIEGRHYFHDFSKNSLSFETDVSVRLSKQLSVYVEFEADIVHDQFYLIKDQGASRDDLLLERRKLATAYELGGEVGFRFTFGSIYNNVVNERF